MAVHKLNIESFDEIDFKVIGICSGLEDYRLAFLINQQLPIVLSRNKKDICIAIDGRGFNFSVFSYYNKEAFISWDLIQNKTTLVEQNKGDDMNLFSDIDTELTINGYLLPEYKQIDFFLKISNSYSSETIDAEIALNFIMGVLKVQDIDLNQTRYRSNLIF